jgi:hypothetical protein
MSVASPAISTREDDISAVLPFIMPGRKGVVMALGSFFDESVGDGCDDPLSVCGYIFKPTDYQRFARQWARMLRGAPGGSLPFIHMKEVYHGKKSCDGRTIEQRREIINQASRLVTDYMLGGAGVTFRQAEFEREAPASWPQMFGSIYAASCQLCLRATVHWLKTHNTAGSVVYAFEKGHKFGVEAERMIAGIGADPALRRRFRYKNHFFAAKRDAAGLQAADMLAWLCTQIAINKQFSDAGRTLIEQFVLDSLGDERYVLPYLTGPSLLRFFNEQATLPKMGPFDVGLRKRTFR